MHLNCFQIKLDILIMCIHRTPRFVLMSLSVLCVCVSYLLRNTVKSVLRVQLLYVLISTQLSNTHLKTCISRTNLPLGQPAQPLQH